MNTNGAVASNLQQRMLLENDNTVSAARHWLKWYFVKIVSICLVSVLNASGQQTALQHRCHKVVAFCDFLAEFVHRIVCHIHFPG